MLNKPFILDHIVKSIDEKFAEDNKVVLLGADRTGKSEILKRIETDLAQKDIPFYTIKCHIKMVGIYDENCGNPLVLSTLYNGDKIKYTPNGMSREEEFYIIAKQLLDYLSSNNENKGVLILDNYENLGPFFLQKFTQIFWNLENIRILVSLNPLRSPISEREELKHFQQVDLKAESLRKLFHENQDLIFSNTSFDIKQREFIISRSNNFETLFFFISHGLEIFNNSAFEFDNYFKKVLNGKNENTVVCLKSSATIGSIFEKRLLSNPLNIENLDAEMESLLYSGEIYALKNNEEYSFTFERFFDYLLNNINKQDYTRWTRLLGNYLFDEALRYKHNFNEYKYVELMRKSCSYLLKGNEFDKACYISFKLINTYYKENRYDELLTLIEELLTSECRNEIKIYLLNTLINLLNRFSIYSKAKKNLDLVKDFQLNCPIAGDNWIYTTIQEAEYFYLYSGEKISIKLLSSIKGNNIMNDYPTIGYEMNALLSSVLYNAIDIDDFKAPQKCYTNALNYGQAIKDSSYYKLLQKAIIFDIPDSQKLIEQACNYFEITNNKIDLARSKHNLGVWYFEQGQYSKAKDNFEEAKTLFDNNLMKNLLAYPYNNLAAVKMIQSNYSDAINDLVEALKYSNDEEFSIITINFNISGCYYKLNNETKSAEYLKKALDTINASKNGDSHFYKLFENTHFALYHLNKDNSAEAYKYLDKIITPHLFYKQLISFAKGEHFYQQYEMPYLADVLENKICPHYMVFE